MKRIYTLPLAAAMMWLGANSSEACTNLIAAKGATTDGSVMVTYAADSHNLYGMLTHTPAARHPKGTMRKVVEWDTGKPLGEIPQPAQTYNVVGNMNEHQLAIGESTWGGHKELVDTTGQSIIDYGSLIQITLERCKTAREAVDFMGDIVNKYGYASSGESFSIADKNEVWVMEMIGKGAEKGAVWIAVRIPDNAISGHANEPRIRKVDMKDKKNVKYSKDVISFARKRGYFNGKDEDFSFADAYENHSASTRRGCDARVWSYFRRFAPETDRYYAWCASRNSIWDRMCLCHRVQAQPESRSCRNRKAYKLKCLCRQCRTIRFLQQGPEASRGFGSQNSSLFAGWQLRAPCNMCCRQLHNPWDASGKARDMV